MANIFGRLTHAVICRWEKEAGIAVCGAVAGTIDQFVLAPPWKQNTDFWTKTKRVGIITMISGMIGIWASKDPNIALCFVIGSFISAHRFWDKSPEEQCRKCNRKK